MAGLGLDHEYLLFGLKIPCLPRNQQAPADPRTLHGQANLQLLTNFLWAVGKTVIKKQVKSRIGLPRGPCYELVE